MAATGKLRETADGWTPDHQLIEDDLYEMANIYPRRSGLPMTVWVSPRGNARHDARLKVCLIHGNRMVPDNTASVSIRPEPRLVAGYLPPDDLQLVSQWILINRAALLSHWDGDIDSTELGARLVSLSA